MASFPPVHPDSSPASGEESFHSSPALREALHRAADRVADYLGSLQERAIFPTTATPPEGSLLPDIGEPLTELFDSAAD